MGYCILLAEPLASALQPLLATRHRDGSCSGGGSGGRRPRRALAAAALLALLLACFSAKTVLRNRDWLDEEHLFMAAQKVARGGGGFAGHDGVCVCMCADVDAREGGWMPRQPFFWLPLLDRVRCRCAGAAARSS